MIPFPKTFCLFAFLSLLCSGLAVDQSNQNLTTSDVNVLVSTQKQAYPTQTVYHTKVNYTLSFLSIGEVTSKLVPIANKSLDATNFFLDDVSFHSTYKSVEFYTHFPTPSDQNNNNQPKKLYFNATSKLALGEHETDQTVETLLHIQWDELAANSDYVAVELRLDVVGKAKVKSVVKDKSTEALTFEASETKNSMILSFPKDADIVSAEVDEAEDSSSESKVDVVVSTESVSDSQVLIFILIPDYKLPKESGKSPKYPQGYIKYTLTTVLGESVGSSSSSSSKGSSGHHSGSSKKTQKSKTAIINHDKHEMKVVVIASVVVVGAVMLATTLLAMYLRRRHQAHLGYETIQ